MLPQRQGPPGFYSGDRRSAKRCTRASAEPAASPYVDNQPRAIARQTGQARRGAHDAGRHLGWFTEGFDTADLKDAKALLDELA